MFFVYKKWDRFCSDLHKKNIYSIRADELITNRSNKKFLIIKHDVETKPKKALILAKIEAKYNHKCTFYVQANILLKHSNIAILKKIQSLGHEVSYHYDVMDSNKGDINKAIIEFENNIKLFKSNGFDIITLCQHGNPVLNRLNYSSNRDFFRSKLVQTKYPNMFDIMVNYKEKINLGYKYVSDAGFGFKLIFDPINNDIEKNSYNDIVLSNLISVKKFLDLNESMILSIHPHRWSNNYISAILKTYFFKVIRFTTKIFMKIPIIKKILSKFYFLAKKI